MLVKLALQEHTAERSENYRSSAMRRYFAVAYRNAVGVYPQQRHEFRATLETVREAGGPPISDIASRLRLEYELDRLPSDHSNP